MGKTNNKKQAVKSQKNKAKQSQITNKRIASIKKASLVFIWALTVFWSVELLCNESVSNYLSFKEIIFNIFVVIAVLGIWYGVIGNLFYAAVTSTCLIYVLSIVNYYLVHFRGTIFIPTDLLAIKTGLAVAGGYKFFFDAKILIIACLMAVACICIYFCSKRKPKLWERLVAIAAGVFILVSVNTTMVQDTFRIAVSDWKPTMQCQEEGYILTFVSNISKMYIEKPEGYSQKALAQISEQYGSDIIDFDEQRPNIIVVMNESFVDFEKFDTFHASQEVLPFFHSLQTDNDVISGELQVPVFGGGTSRVEFEFLTGGSMSHYFANTPYDTLVTSDMAALPNVLKQLGYHTVALHPETPANWSRNKAYPKMGFDEFVDTYTMQHKERVRKYISDDSFYEEIKMIDEQTDAPLFLFGITMQNHGGYEEPDYTEPIEIVSPYGAYPKAKQYINLMSESDKALEKFITYYKTVEEPTIILFFGDHYPRLEDDFYTKLTAESLHGDEQDELLLYQSPYLIWANFDMHIEKTDAKPLFSTAYLQAMLMECAGLETTGFQKLLGVLQEKYPVILSDFALDSSYNAMYELDSELLMEYKYMQYALLKGDLEKCFNLDMGDEDFDKE